MTFFLSLIRRLIHHYPAKACLLFAYLDKFTSGSQGPRFLHDIINRLSALPALDRITVLRNVLIIAFTLLTQAVVCLASNANEVDYVTQIKTILSEKCYACHGALKQESSLRLETRSLILQGGDSGPAIDLDYPRSSAILERVRSQDEDRMPPEGEGAKLSEEQVQLIERWIQLGAPAPQEAPPAAPSEHWAFQPIQPSLHLSEASRRTEDNPIDTLLSQKQKQEGLTPQPPALRTIQIRRLYLDLIGLPPTLDQLNDDRELSLLIDELLDRPEHGERWGRHWMDIWRYSDWYGLGAQLRNSQKHLWHWRDWIIQSLNDDKGYDQMIREMLAGDEIDPTNQSALAATGYLARNYYLFNRTTWLDNTIEHTSKAFLGLTVNCAKCHDHKYDPISHVDYYRMRAIFEPHQVRLDPIPGVIDFESDGLPRVFDDDLDAITQLHRKGDPKNPDLDTLITAGIPAIFDSEKNVINEVQLPAHAYAPNTRLHVQTDQLHAIDQQITSAEKKLEDSLRQLTEKIEQATHEKQTKPQEPFFFTEDFDENQPDRWELAGDSWEFKEGALHQTKATREPHFAKLKTQLPHDFVLECDYTHTGGTTYRSVTFRFDQSSDGNENNFVYTSAHAAGKKIQAAFTRNGQSTYPAEARKSVDIKEGHQYHLKFALRDRLINVWLDDVFMFAYRFPQRFKGKLSLSGFDSTVAFDQLEIHSVTPDLELREPENGENSPTAPEAAVKIAQAELDHLRSKRESIAATLQADRIRYLDQSLDPQKKRPNETESESRLFLAAAMAQQRLKISEAKLQLAKNFENPEKEKKAADEVSKAMETLESLATKSPENIQYNSFRASKKALESPADKEEHYPVTYPSTSTGRRSTFANWIASKHNPLTARVAVNHVWMRHFGEPLVESVFDFGLRASPPMHQDILDQLAFEFMESGWSFKHLHRIILNSKAYLRSSSNLKATQRCLEADPGNRNYWRMNPRRMESQLVRDSLLHLSKKLDLTLGGPSLNHNHEPARRSLYFKHSPDQKEAFLETFDNADVLACYRRSESIVPQQALAMVNSKLSLSSAEAIADLLDKEAAERDDLDFINHSFESLIGRPATSSEQASCKNFLESIGQLTTNQETNNSQARVRLIHVILNHHEFITIR